MPRIKIQIPKKIVFIATIKIRASDINYGGHVGNDAILTIMQEARIMYYQSLGYKDELNFEGRIGQIISDAAIVYKSESFLSDILTIKISVDDFNKYGFDMYYLIENKLTGNEVARGKTGIVCFDYESRKITTLPEKLLKALQN